MLVQSGSPLHFASGKIRMNANIPILSRLPRVTYGKSFSGISDSGYGGVLRAVSVPQGLYGYKPGQSNLINTSSMSGYGIQFHGEINEIGDISSDITNDISKLTTSGLNLLVNSLAPSAPVTTTPTLTEAQILAVQQAQQPSAFGNMMPYMLIAALGLGAMLILKKKKIPIKE
jgi:hypothetical protein